MFSTIRLHLISAATVLILAGCGGGGGDGGGLPLGSPPASGAPSKVFVSDSGNAVIASTATTNPAPGLMTIDRIISGPNAGITNGVRALAYDATNDRLYVGQGSSILVFNNASLADGNVSPARTMTSASIGFIYSLFLDTANDVMYVGDGGNSKVLAFNAISTANGARTPIRSISVTWNSGAFSLNDISIDTSKNILYVSGSGSVPSFSNLLLVYDNANMLDGTSVTANRALSFNLSTLLWGIFVDPASDRLFVSSYGDRTIMVFDGASTANGVASPNRTINMSSNTPHIFVDTVRDRLYAMGSRDLYVIDNASTASGSVVATYVLAPTGSVLEGLVVAP